jgi:hypothetical protein
MTVVMSFPLGEVVQNQDATRSIAKWALELMGEGISYAPRIAIKSQVLANFIAKWTKIKLPPAVIDRKCWTMYFDKLLMKKAPVWGWSLFSPWGTHEVHGLSLLPYLQQCGRV